MTDVPFNRTGWTDAELLELERAWTPSREPAPLLAEIRRASLRGRSVIVTAERPPSCFRFDQDLHVLELLYYGEAPEWDPEDARRQAERIREEYPPGTRFILVGERAVYAGRGILDGSRDGR